MMEGQRSDWAELGKRRSHSKTNNKPILRQVFKIGDRFRKRRILEAAVWVMGLVKQTLSL